MTLVFGALFFCCLCSIGCVWLLTARQRVISREIRLIQVRCAMLDALEELDKRIWSGNFPAKSLTIAFQQFAWQAKGRSFIFTMKSFWFMFFGGIEQFAFAMDLHRRIKAEMSCVPRLYHAQCLFLDGYYQFMSYRHPIYTFLLCRRNRWLMQRYLLLSKEERRELVAAYLRRSSNTESLKDKVQKFRSGYWSEFLPCMQAA